MGYRLHLRIPGLPRIQAAGTRGHWSQRVREKNYWIDLVGWQAIAAGRPPEPLKRAKLTLIRHSHGEPDYVNLVSSFKAPEDGLVQCGVLQDDSPQVVEHDIRWEACSSEQKGFIEIIVEEIEP